MHYAGQTYLKDAMRSHLNDSTSIAEERHEFEMKSLRSKCDDDLNELQQRTDHIISELSTRLKTAENELRTFEAFRKTKDVFDKKLRHLEQLFKEEEESKIQALENQERNFFEEKAHIFNDFDSRESVVREKARHDAKEAMGSEASRIISDNNRMYEELQFLQITTADIECEKVSTVEIACFCTSLPVLSQMASCGVTLCAKIYHDRTLHTSTAEHIT